MLASLSKWEMLQEAGIHTGEGEKPQNSTSTAQSDLLKDVLDATDIQAYTHMARSGRRERAEAEAWQAGGPKSMASQISPCVQVPPLTDIRDLLFFTGVPRVGRKTRWYLLCSHQDLHFGVTECRVSN